MTGFPRNSERGVALVITILLLAILIAVVAQLAYMTKTEVRVSRTYMGSLQNSAATDSAVNIARKYLQIDRHLSSDVDHLKEGWTRLFKPEQLNQANVQFRIIDEERRINVNRIVKTVPEGTARNEPYFTIMKRLFQGLNLNPLLVDRIRDYMIVKTGPNRFEQEESIQTFHSPGSLLKVKGITPEILHGTDNRAPLLQYITTQSNGQININTAPPMVFQALADDITISVANEIISFREKTNGKDEEKAYFSSKSDLLKAINETVIAQDTDQMKKQIRDVLPILTVKSTNFSVYVRAEAEGVKKTSRTVLKTFKGSQRPDIKWFNRNIDGSYVFEKNSRNQNSPFQTVEHQ